MELLRNHQVPDFPPASVGDEDGFQQTAPLGCTRPLPFPLDWRGRTDIPSVIESRNAEETGIGLWMGDDRRED